MRVLYVKEVFALERSSDLGERPRRAHWRWHGRTGCSGGCPACTAGLPSHYWWTTAAARVAEVVTCALRDGLPVEIDDHVLVDHVARHADTSHGVHVCPGGACLREVGAATLCCRACWFKLTRAERATVWEAWVAYQRDAGEHKHYAAAVAAVVQITGERHDRPKEPAP